MKIKISFAMKNTTLAIISGVVLGVGCDINSTGLQIGGVIGLVCCVIIAISHAVNR